MIRAEKLSRRKPNAFCVVSDVTDYGSVLGIKRRIVGMTEITQNTSSPEWAQIIFLDHTLAQEHRFAIDVYHSNADNPNVKIKFDTDSELIRGSPKPKNCEQIGGLLFEIESVLSQPDRTYAQKMPRSNGGKIHVRLEATRMGHGDPKDLFRFQIRGVNLPNTRNFMDRPDFKLEIRRKSSGQTQDTWDLVYNSAPCPNTLNPSWDLDEIPLISLCNYNFSRELRLTVVDAKASLTGQKQVLGSTDTTLQGLLDAKLPFGVGNSDVTRGLSIRNEAKKDKKLGSIIVIEAKILNAADMNRSSFSRMSMTEGTMATARGIPESAADSVASLPTAVEVLEVMPAPAVDFDAYQRRTDMGLCVGVDFHCDNGDPDMPGSPHYSSDGGLNDFKWILSVLGETLKDYSSSQEYPLWGTSAKFSGRQVDIFQMGATPTAAGTFGMLQAYNETMDNHGMNPSTSRRNFDKIILGAAHHSKKAAASALDLSYTLLVVLTSGSDEDVMRSKEKLLQVSPSPLSVLFVRVDNGVGHTMSDVKLHTYMGSRGDSRMAVDCVDAKEICKYRNALQLAKVVLDKLRRDVPVYFQSRGV